MTISYNRTAALAYARAYWTKSCSDGYVAVKQSPYFKQVDAATVFLRTNAADPSSEVARPGSGPDIPLSDLEDCTHFISCCLGSPPGGTGGGIPITRDFNTIYGRLGANNLYNDLINQNRVEIVAEKKTFAQAASFLSSLQAGDLIFYFDTSHNRYGHSAIYLAGSEKRIACHTYCRSDANSDYPQSWDSVNLPLCTLLKVKSTQPLSELESRKYLSALSYGQLSNQTGETLLVYGPKIGGTFDNSLFYLPTGRKTPNGWDCDGFLVPNDRFADQLTSTNQGPLAVKYLDFRTPIIERLGVNYECSLNNGLFRSGQIHWEIPNLAYSAVPGSYPIVPGHVPA
jgi:Putative amidase domain